MTQISGVDYSWARPDLAQLRAQGYEFVVRYLSGSPGGKDLSIPERDELLGAGLSVVVVWETDGTTGPQSGNGAPDARAAVAEAVELGVPQGACIYFAVDFDANAAQLAGPIRSYFASAAAYCRANGYRCGGYGGIDTVNAIVDLVDFTWQTYAWSAGNVAPSDELYQYQNGVTVAGGDVDLDKALTNTGDYGQFPVVAAPSPSQGIGTLDDMADTGVVIVVKRGSGRIDTYELADNGDVDHKWEQPGKGTLSERIGQNGSDENTGLRPPSKGGTITGYYDDAQHATVIKGIRDFDDHVWRAVQSDDGATWVCDIEP